MRSSSVSLTNLGIQSIGIYIPESVESNFDKKEQFGMDDQFIRNKLGIEQVTRKLVDEETSDMCINAFMALNAQCSIDIQSIECVVVVTQNPDGDGLPHTSAIVHGKLGCAPHCAAFDIALGCSGYVYALSIITAFMQQNKMTTGVLFTADPYSKILDPADRNTVTLFGDAATATLITDRPRFCPTAFAFGTDGLNGHALKCTSGRLIMNGRAVFDFSSREVPQQIVQLLTRNKLTLDQVDLVLLHQGSKFIVEAIGRRLDVSEQKIPLALQKTGNTISSSIPLLLMPLLNDSSLQVLVLSGFGVGLSWASAIVQRCF